MGSRGGTTLPLGIPTEDAARSRRVATGGHRPTRTGVATFASAVCVGAALLTGCGSGPTGDTTTAVTGPDEFVGSPAEYAAAQRSCMQDRGWEITNSEDASFTIELSGRSDDEYFDDLEACRAEVGAEPTSDLSEQDLRARYSWRRDQYDCLASEGFAVGAPKSFESFVDGYERTGTPSWDPIADFAEDGEAVARANIVCPYSTSEW